MKNNDFIFTSVLYPILKKEENYNNLFKKIYNEYKKPNNNKFNKFLTYKIAISITSNKEKIIKEFREEYQKHLDNKFNKGKTILIDYDNIIENVGMSSEIKTIEFNDVLGLFEIGLSMTGILKEYNYTFGNNEIHTMILTNYEPKEGEIDIYLDSFRQRLKEKIKKPQVVKQNRKNQITKSIRHEIFKRDNYKCLECGATNKETTLHLDHINPISKGGTDEMSNFQTLCSACNLSKSNRMWKGGIKK